METNVKAGQVPVNEAAIIDYSKLPLEQLNKIVAEAKAKAAEAKKAAAEAKKAEAEAEKQKRLKADAEKYQKCLANFAKVQINVRGTGLKDDGKDYWYLVEDEATTNALKAFLEAKVAEAKK